MQYEVISSIDVDQDAGLISDQLVKLKSYKSSKSYPEAFRLVIYEDFATGIVYTFMTNDFDLATLTIMELYRERWKVELFFYEKQKIKQSNQQKTSWVHQKVLLLFIKTLHKYVPDNSRFKQESFEKVYR